FLSDPQVIWHVAGTFEGRLCPIGCILARGGRRLPPWYISGTMSFAKRKKTVTVDVGGVKVGSERPIVVQSMTHTDTADIAGTVAQVNALHAAGSELVRVTVNNDEAARAVPEIVRQ